MDLGYHRGFVLALAAVLVDLFEGQALFVPSGDDLVWIEVLADGVGGVLLQQEVHRPAGVILVQLLQAVDRDAVDGPAARGLRTPDLLCGDPLVRGLLDLWLRNH